MPWIALCFTATWDHKKLSCSCARSTGEQQDLALLSISTFQTSSEGHTCTHSHMHTLTHDMTSCMREKICLDPRSAHYQLIRECPSSAVQYQSAQLLHGCCPSRRYTPTPMHTITTQRVWWSLFLFTQSVTDMSPYVRKTAAHAIPKLFRCNAFLHRHIILTC